MQWFGERPLAFGAAVALLARQIRDTLTLAVPVMAARAGLVIMITVDTVMTGQAGTLPLAQYAISLAPHVILLVVGIGAMSGTTILVAQAQAAGRPESCGAIWHMSLAIAAIVGIATGLTMTAGEPLFRLLEQPAEVASGGGRALLGFAPGMPAMMMYIATIFLLEGIGRPRVGMVIALTANLANIALNWLLIDGHLGAPTLGAAGATLATSATRWLMLAAALGYVLVLLPDRDRLGVRSRHLEPWRTAVKLLRIGLPLAAATALETSAFATIASFAGRLGETPLAAYQATMNVVSLVFMLSIGLSTATTIRVAGAVGRCDRRGLALAGWTGIVTVVLLMTLLGGAIALLAPGIAALYSSDPAVRATATAALALVSIIVVADGLQWVAMGALRGAGDVSLPTAIYAVSFWGLALPLAYGLGLKGAFGVNGLFLAILAGVTLAGLLLVLRFAVVGRRDVRPY